MWAAVIIRLCSLNLPAINITHLLVCHATCFRYLHNGWDKGCRGWKRTKAWKICRGSAGFAKAGFAKAGYSVWGFGWLYFDYTLPCHVWWYTLLKSYQLGSHRDFFQRQSRKVNVHEESVRHLVSSGMEDIFQAQSAFLSFLSWLLLWAALPSSCSMLAVWVEMVAGSCRRILFLVLISNLIICKICEWEHMAAVHLHGDIPLGTFPHALCQDS